MELKFMTGVKKSFFNQLYEMCYFSKLQQYLLNTMFSASQSKLLRDLPASAYDLPYAQYRGTRDERRRLHDLAERSGYRTFVWLAACPLHSTTIEEIMFCFTATINTCLCKYADMMNALPREHGYCTLLVYPLSLSKPRVYKLTNCCSRLRPR